MKASPIALNLIEQYEGFSPTLYNCPANDCTIGYGHKVHKGPINGTASEQEFANGITQEQATELLAKDVTTTEDAINKLVHVPLAQNQFDALVDFTYNVGSSNFANSTLLRKLNVGDYVSVPNELMRWVYVNGQVSNGLVARRTAEASLFEEKGWTQ